MAINLCGSASYTITSTFNSIAVISDRHDLDLELCYVHKPHMIRQSTVRKPTEGRTIALVGDVYRFLATGKDTNGKYTTFEVIVRPGGGPPPHVHSREEECFYILDGELTLWAGDERIVATAGMFINLPVGIPH